MCISDDDMHSAHHRIHLSREKCLFLEGMLQVLKCFKSGHMNSGSISKGQQIKMQGVGLGEEGKHKYPMRIDRYDDKFTKNEKIKG